MSEFCDAVPSCLVHGDFVPKNAHVRIAGKETRLLLMDWQTAGWGSPAPDVMRLDAAAYRSAVESRWPHLDAADITELARIGTIFRAVAAIDWESRMLAHPWVDAALRNIRGYEGWLTLAGKGASYRIGSSSL
jgi:aminoglycoside phosphotransferase (APT) family kinase protein